MKLKHSLDRRQTFSWTSLQYITLSRVITLVQTRNIVTSNLEEHDVKNNMFAAAE